MFPGIFALLIGGMIMFFLAYNFYPNKYFNLNLNGDCYEFSGKAYAKYHELEKEKEKETLWLQAKAIGDPKAIIPITFSGTTEEVNEFVLKNNINVTERLQAGDNNLKIDKIIIKGKITDENFEKIIKNEFNISDYNSFIKTIVHSLGIESNAFLTSQESKQITKQMEHFTEDGLEKIVDEKDGVKPIECSNKITYYVP